MTRHFKCAFRIINLEVKHRCWFFVVAGDGDGSGNIRMRERDDDYYNINYLYKLLFNCCSSDFFLMMTNGLSNERISHMIILKNCFACVVRILIDFMHVYFLKYVGLTGSLKKRKEVVSQQVKV